MQTQNYWKQFENTGKIEDYLSYKNSCFDKEDQVDKVIKEAERREAESYAGIHTSDGHDLKTDAYR